MLTRQSHDGVGRSVVELPDARHVYLAAVPRAGDDLAGQVRDVLATLRAAAEDHGASGSIVAQSVFVSDLRAIDACRRLIEEFYGDQMPATTYVPQVPCPGRLVAVEAFGIGSGGRSVQIDRFSPQLVVARHDGVAWCHCADVVAAGRNGPLYDRVLHSFGQMDRLLDNAGFHFSQVVRTWLYLGDIVGPEGPRQRYQELNRARDRFYADVPFCAPCGQATGYPASTGIGALGDGVAMSCIALASGRDDLRVVPLENPDQTSAFEYGRCHSPHSPRFSRAVAVVGHHSITMFVSGTASITGSESRHANDVDRQTGQTLDNIESLVASANLRRHGIEDAGLSLADLAHVRVYLKRPGDYERVHAICRERIGELPAIYAVADICRQELLVEIEAVAFAPRGRA